MMGWAMLLGVILFLVVIAGLIALIVWAMRHSGASGQPADIDKPTYATLKRRYAQGEIDSEEFERVKRQLDIE
jgi:uncharacterized membrane protein